MVMGGIHETSEACSEVLSHSYSVPGRVGALFLILGVSTIGVCLPILSLALQARGLGRSALATALTSPHARAFGLGIILCVCIVHMIPESAELLTSPCLHLPEKTPSITGIVVLASALLMQTISSFAYRTLMSSGAAAVPEPATLNDHDIEGSPVKGSRAEGESLAGGCYNPHVHGGQALALLQKSRQNMVAVILLEIGVAIHSVIIGIDLGIHPGGKSLQPLLVALCFHQLFEGLAVGTALVHAKIAKRWVLMASAFIFSVSLPLGCGIGIGLRSSFSENSRASLLSRGVLDASAAGILLYTGFVDLMAGWFGNANSEFHAGGWAVVGGSNVFLWLGAAAMAVLASWA